MILSFRATAYLMGVALCATVTVDPDGGRSQSRTSRTMKAPAAYCRDVGTDDMAHPTPRSLAGSVRQRFGLHASDAEIAQTSIYRCSDHHLLICTVGANLNCGKANMNRSLRAADQYCLSSPGSSFIPMVVTGHDTAFSWRCEGPKAVAGDALQPIDSRGFVAANWKRAD